MPDLNGQWYQHEHLLTLFAIFYESNTEVTNFLIMLASATSPVTSLLLSTHCFVTTGWTGDVAQWLESRIVIQRPCVEPPGRAGWHWQTVFLSLCLSQLLCRPVCAWPPFVCMAAGPHLCTHLSSKSRHHSQWYGNTKTLHTGKEKRKKSLGKSGTMATCFPQGKQAKFSMHCSGTGTRKLWYNLI